MYHQVGQRHGEVREHRSVGIFGPAPHRCRDAPDQQAHDTDPGARGRQRTPRDGGESAICPAPPQLRANIVPRLDDFFDLLGKRQR